MPFRKLSSLDANRMEYLLQTHCALANPGQEMLGSRDPAFLLQQGEKALFAPLHALCALSCPHSRRGVKTSSSSIQQETDGAGLICEDNQLSYKYRWSKQHNYYQRTEAARWFGLKKKVKAGCQIHSRDWPAPRGMENPADLNHPDTCLVVCSSQTRSFSAATEGVRGGLRSLGGERVYEQAVQRGK